MRLKLFWNGLAEEADDAQDEHEDHERGPVVLCSNAPLLAEAPQQELKEVKSEEERDQDEDKAEEDAANDVAEDVVAHFVAEDEEDFVRSAFGDGGVPDDDALGGAESGHIGVQSSDFVGGLHQEHALRRNIDAFASGDHAFQLRDQFGVGFAERLEFIEERIDDVGAGEDGEQR